MSVDIFILSYNRPLQLQRIFDNFLGVILDDVNLIIKDDCSPQIDLIEELYFKYKPLLLVNLVLHKNHINLGYDMNLLDCFCVGSSEYIFLLSNDDYIEACKLPKFLNFLSREKPDGLICSYKSANHMHRLSPLDCDSKYTANLLYDSILFSGLVFNRSMSKFILPHIDFLKNCIYSQVFLIALLKERGLLLVKYSEELLVLGGDGENFFGKNASSIDEYDLADRTNPLSVFRYQLRLWKVVDYIDAELFCGFGESFQAEYSRRLLGFLLKLRSSCSIGKYLEYQNEIVSGQRFFTKRLYLVSILVAYFPRRISRAVYFLGRKIFKRSG